jgi:hypothetical protein
MPVALLDGKPLSVIREMRKNGEIPIQVYQKHDGPAQRTQARARHDHR